MKKSEFKRNAQGRRTSESGQEAERPVAERGPGGRPAGNRNGISESFFVLEVPLMNRQFKI